MGQAQKTPPDPIPPKSPTHRPAAASKSMLRDPKFWGLTSILLLFTPLPGVPTILKQYLFEGTPPQDWIQGTLQGKVKLQNSGYDPQISIATSAPQNGLSFGGTDDFITTLNDSIQNLPSHGKLEDAFTKLDQEGFDGFPVNIVESRLKVFPHRSGPPIAGWQIEDRQTPRYVLALYQNKTNQATEFRQDTEELVSTVQKRFHVPPEHVVMAGVRNQAEADAKITEFRQKLFTPSLRDPHWKPPEILIMLNTHGRRPQDADTLAPGKALGQTSILNEQKLAELLRDLTPITRQQTVILESCYSGAFTVAPPKKQP
jgi:hypothetical protein